MKSVLELYKEEDSRLSPLAIKNQETEDRVFPEELHLYRLPLHRDRDRIYHSRAFKRLEYKTQVFVNSEGDNFRTRLTHTLEVAGVARTVATALGLNSHLAEVIALAHDLGHTPFGHAGQDILSELMKEHGGFEHNKQSLRIVQKLENRYIEFSGLNLSRMTLIGLMKHGGGYEKSDLQILRNEEGPSLEALVTDVSDEIAYSHHDIEDGIEKGLLTKEQLSDNDLWNEKYTEVLEKSPSTTQELIARKTIRLMMNSAITDLILSTESNIKHFLINSREDFSKEWKKGNRVVDYSSGMNNKIKSLKKFLLENFYRHPTVLEKSNKGQQIIEKIYFHLIKNTNLIPENYIKRADEEGIYRIVSDYISGMTDRYAEKKFIEFGFT
jgi:dGTPase